MAEMRAAGADWQVLLHGNAGHGFTRKDAHLLGVPGIAYDAEAESRSWRAMRAFLDEIFGID